jgi:hypothetical protein
MPEAEIGDLIIEVRSATAEWDRLSSNSTSAASYWRMADQIVAARRAAE